MTDGVPCIAKKSENTSVSSVYEIPYATVALSYITLGPVRLVLFFESAGFVLAAAVFD